MDELNKKEIAAQLKEAANLLDVLASDPFKAKAFMNASRQIEAFEGDIADLLKNDKLTSIRGVGQGVATELAFLKTQESIPILDDLYERVPEGVRDLFRVSGLGAKKIAVLWQHNISSLQGLIEAVNQGDLAAIKGFGAKSAGKFAQAAQFAIEAKRRMRLDIAESLSNAVKTLIQNKLPKIQLHSAGEYRRKCETIGALEFVASNVTTSDLALALSDLGFLSEEENKVTLELEGRLIHFYLTTKDALGAVLAFRSGSTEFVVGLKESAQSKELELLETGLFESGELLLTPTEDSFFEALELPFVVPELREEKHARSAKSLLELSDIKGQIHNHSTWSDAVHSIRDMVDVCIKDGYSYFAMADHSKTSYYANGLSEERVLAQAEEIRLIRQDLKAKGSEFELLHGIEVDIMTDGRLDYEDDLLATLDYAVVSVHQNFTLSEEDQTNRIIKAISNPYAKILAHPTGRILLRRPEYAVNLDKLIDACAETQTIIEINASPYRLDLDWRWVKKAKEKGCKFSINPDAHHIDQLSVTKYGVFMARKAGLTKEDVVNTAETAEAFLAQLKPQP